MKSFHISSCALSLGALALLLGGCGGSQQSGVPAEYFGSDALQYHKTFKYTGKLQFFKVPAGVTSIAVVALGAAGQSEVKSGPHAHPGLGGRVYAVLPVKSRETLFVFVGGEGATGGFDGGGRGGSGSGPSDYGGGASDVRQHGDSLSDRVLVAGGGGAQGSGAQGTESSVSGSGGNGGGKIGQTGGRGLFGPSACARNQSGGGGTGGTQDRGGTGGVRGGDGRRGGSGVLGSGGIGGDGGGDRTGYVGGAGGGGGGGYYGGGGGGGAQVFCSGGGGGGGSSYVESIATNVRMWQGWKSANGNGLVVFDW
jgi:hypothetical protein